MRNDPFTANAHEQVTLQAKIPIYLSSFLLVDGKPVINDGVYCVIRCHIYTLVS
jgi:hypothetical protein